MDIIFSNNDQRKHAKLLQRNDQNLHIKPRQIIISRQNSTSSDNSDSSLESVLTEKDNDVVPSQTTNPAGEPNSDEKATFRGSRNDMSLSPQPHQLSPRVVIPPGYDPARIPGSVFGAKASTPMDWSFASNESLFSLHVGNTSFSKDQFLSMYKSGELTKFDQELARFSGVVSHDQFNFASEGFDQSYGEISPLGLSNNKERDRFDWSYNNTPPSFQFPVLFGGYDGTIITSPTMEPKRQWTSEKKHHSRPLTQIMQKQQRLEAKQEHVHTSNWLFCFTCCFKPCRGCMAYLKT